MYDELISGQDTLTLSRILEQYSYSGFSSNSPLTEDSLKAILKEQGIKETETLAFEDFCQLYKGLENKQRV